jgi:hypothetical protein
MPGLSDSVSGRVPDCEPPAWALPVTVPGDVVLLRQSGAMIAVTAVCAYPVGFVFYLIAGFDLSQADGPARLQFRVRTAAEQASAARLQVSFPDGRVADSVADQAGLPTAERPVLTCVGEGGTQEGGYLLQESRWWVSPLPPAGPVDITIYLGGSAVPGGTGRIDARLITEAAARCDVLRSPGGHP